MAPHSSSPPTRRVVDVIALLTESARGYTIAEIAKATGAARATATAVLTELTAAGWTIRDSELRYRLGPALSGLHVPAPPIPAGVDDVLTALAARAGCGVTLSRIEPRRLTVVAKHHAGLRIVPGLSVGQRIPLAYPAGAAVMPWRERDDRDAWLATAPAPRRAGIELLGTVREFGCAVFRPVADDVGLVDVLADLLAVVGSDVLRPQLRDRVLRQLASLTSRPYTATELHSDAALPVSYLTAPVFDDALPGFEVQLAPLRPAVPGAEREAYVAALREAAQELSELSVAGGSGRAPAKV
ncbi:helix-turn-helix domain-containing protein [Aldersonia sp. NBC_00410]|uniref:helix-turn-helix domain-containing protein n=1 Tax=Aldersonia sp. NBC_00410 TaxID=2975954 RepID=UPI00225B9B58|nr:helix-turn-helix domain-containing protein [Aldersonia sp. NBC_00410]MCX5042270.1 helix-turn-helix domain-containing protein [Aldersonia sp. NBC_00410]